MKRSSKPSPKLKTIDEFLAALSAAKRGALQKLREDIRAAAPAAGECICYGVPAFRLNGRFLFARGATAKHCTFYPGAVVAAFKKELQGYSTSKGTFRFQRDHPLPVGLGRKLVKAQIARRLPGKPKA